jgi:hypothetical protein
MLDLVAGQPLPAWCTETGAVHAEIGAEESLADVDFRPLVGLRVHLSDRSGDEARLRRAAKLAAEVNPELLCVFVERGDSMTMFRRWADGRTDRRAM